MKHLLWGLAAVLIVWTGVGCSNQSDAPRGDEGSARSPSLAVSDDPLVRGARAYEQYCQSCHGEAGRGNGALNGELATPAADLSTLTERYGGTYPAELVYETIDGREGVEAHGTREMPVWGNIWAEEDGQPVAEAEVEARISELVEYVRTLQAGEETM